MKGRDTEARRQTGPDLMAAYWRDIERYQPLSREQETDLVQRARAGDHRATEALVTANLRFVVTVAKRYTSYGIPFIELIAEGNAGLLEAVQRFDESRGFKFITYAVWWIRQAILKALAEQSRIARPPMSQVNDLQKVERCSAQLTQRLGRLPSAEEIARDARISLDRARNALELDQSDLSLDAPVFPDEEDSLLTFLAGEETALEGRLEREALCRTVRHSLEILDEREQLILRAYFGLDGRQPMTLEEIGQVLDLTRERVRQLRDRALQSLRSEYGRLLLELSTN
ncbi:MAG: RNA polymerase sigma factor RpoD/SigA [Gemmatimonadota bacterium]